MRNRVTAVLLIVFLVLLITPTAQAQHRWKGHDKHWYSDWMWWVGEAVIIGSFVADAHSTAMVRDRCPGCVETNIVLGPHPSNRRLVIGSAALFGTAQALHIASYESCPDPDHRYTGWRVACSALVPALAVGVKTSATIHNYELADRK